MQKKAHDCYTGGNANELGSSDRALVCLFLETLKIRLKATMQRHNKTPWLQRPTHTSGSEMSQIRRISLELQNPAQWIKDGRRVCVRVCFTCVKVLAGFVGVHGAMTNRRLYCSQWRDDACAGKELVDG